MSPLGVRDALAQQDSPVTACFRTLSSTQAAYETISRRRADLENQKSSIEQSFEKALSDVRNVGGAAASKVEGVFDSAELHFAELRKICRQLADIRENETASLQRLDNASLSHLRSIRRSLRSTQSTSRCGASPGSPTTSQQDAEAAHLRDSTSPPQRESIDAIRTGHECRNQEPNADAVDTQSTVNCEREAGPRSADGNIDDMTEVLQSPSERVKYFSEINSGGQATHRIVNPRHDKENFYVFLCDGSDDACVDKRVFYHGTDSGLLKAVADHAKSSHGIATGEWPEISRQMGWKVIDCTSDDAKLNNKAFDAVVASRAHEMKPKRLVSRKRGRATSRGAEDGEFRHKSAQRVEKQRVTRDHRPRTAAVRPPSETAAELEQDAETCTRASLERGTSPPWYTEAVLQQASEHALAAITASIQPQDALASRYSPARSEMAAQAAPVANMS